MLQQGCNFLLNNSKWRGKHLWWVLMALIIHSIQSTNFAIFWRNFSKFITSKKWKKPW
jgi:hypothetical protein